MLLISDDLDEILALADRIAVMHARPAHRGAAARRVDARRDRPGDGRAPRGRMSGVVTPMRLEARTAGSRGWLLARARRSAASSFTLLVSALLVRLGRRAGRRAPTRCCSRAASARAFAWTETLTRATPLILTGLAAAVAFRARLFNIGAEGQLYAGALAAVAVGGMHGGSGFELPALAAVRRDDGRRGAGRRAAAARCRRC